MTAERDDWKPENKSEGQNENGQDREKKSFFSSNKDSYGSNERRPYNRDSNSPNSYNSDKNSGYGSQGGNYGRQSGGYGGNQNRSYNRPTGGNYERRDNSGGSSYNRGRQDSGSSYGNRPQRSYDNPQRSGNYDNPQRGGYDNSYRSGNSGNYDNSRSYGSSQRPYENRERKPYSSNSGYSSGNSYNSTPADSEGSNGIIKKRRPRVGEVAPPMRGGNSYGNDRPNSYGNDRPSYGNDRPSYGGGRPNNNRDSRSGGSYNRPQQGRPGQGYNQGGGNYQRRPGNTGDYNPNAKYSIQKQMKYREENWDPNEPLRLNKYLANAGVCSRREADEFIKAGVVKVNDVVVTELGTKVKRADQVMFQEQLIKLEHKIYVLLNKPKNCVTTADDPQERLTVMDLVKTACKERIFPVGRLDRNTTGVLLLTNDGDLASKLTHPKFLKKKIYHVWLDKPVTIADMQKMAEGIELEDGEIHADAISYITETDKDQVGIEIHSGRNRIVRRMFETLGYHVIKLDRVYFAGLTKKFLKRGQWRYLSDKEVAMLRMGAFE